MSPDDRLTTAAADGAGQPRLALVDALRGAAMLGIMLVNFPTMNTRAGDETTQYGGVHDGLDRAVGLANMAFCNGKFYPIFALLFGWGLAVLWRSWSRREGRPGRLLFRRLLVLLGFGVLHIALVWWGDILLVYAVIGLMVLPCLRCRDGTLGRGAAALLLFVPLLSPVLALLDRMGVHASDAVLMPGLGLASPTSEQVGLVYGGGRFVEMLGLRLHDYLSDFTPFGQAKVSLGAVVGYGTYYAQLAGLFLLGMWAERKQLAVRLAGRGERAVAFLCWAGLAAVGLTSLRYGVAALRETLYYYQGEALALFYVATFALVFPALGRAGRPFQAVGRLSLTAYLAHTILASLILYGTGLGLYGRIGPAALLVVALVSYAIIAACCVLWTRWFLFGPAEWVWRSLVSGRRERFRRHPAAAPADGAAG